MHCTIEPSFNHHFFVTKQSMLRLINVSSTDSRNFSVSWDYEPDTLIWDPESNLRSIRWIVWGLRKLKSTLRQQNGLRTISHLTSLHLQWTNLKWISMCGLAPQTIGPSGCRRRRIHSSSRPDKRSTTCCYLCDPQLIRLVASFIHSPWARSGLKGR